MIYVMSDIHGNWNRYQSIMKQINLKPDDTLYILGDVIDRHPHGILILEEIMNTPNIHMLLGNHEYMMLEAICCDSKGKTILWYKNSGKVTHDSFNELSEEKQGKILDYLKGLPINIDIEVNGQKYKLVHACPIEWYERLLYPEYKDEKEFAVWNRIYKPKGTEDYTIVFGHTTTNFYKNNSFQKMTVYKTDKMIGIDCGSGYVDFVESGRLSCLRLDDMKEFYSE